MTSRARKLVFVAVALLAAALVPSPGGSRAQTRESITFVVHGLRSNAGIVRGGIYASSSVWTTVGGQVAVCTARPSGGSARCELTPPGPGRYAFAFYHDADGDNVLDVDAIGIPQEGYGFSNDVRPGLGAPPFESAAFTVAAGAVYEARVVARYGWTP